MSEVSSLSTNQQANGHFSKREGRGKMRSARVRLVPLEQSQWLSVDGYQAETRDVAATLVAVSSPRAQSEVKPFARTTNRATKVFTLIVSCLALFMVLLDGTIVNVALPTIQMDLHAQLSDLQWVVDAYTLPLAVLVLTGGTLGDRFGRKRLFLSGLVVFLFGSMLCGFASTLGWILFGRAVQGVGAAALSPGSLSVLATAFPDPRERAQALGLWAGIGGIAVAIGPLAGGFLIQIASWPAIFFVNLPVGLVALLLGWLFLAESRNPAARKIDLPGQVFMIGLLTCLIMALIESSTAGWTSPLILSLFIGSLICLCAFLLVEARVQEPMLPLSLFSNRVFSVANTASLVNSFAFAGTIFFVTQYFQEVLGYTALESGLHTLPILASLFLASPLAGRLAARTGPRLPIVVGAVLFGSSLFLLMRLTTADEYATLWWNLCMLGTGYALMWSPIIGVVLSATPPHRAGLVSSVTSTTRQVGVTLGVAVIGTFVTQQFSSNMASQLAQRGVPDPISAAIANKIVSTGGQASRVPLSGRLPLPPEVLHQAIGQAFVDAVDQSFLITGTAVLAIALLVAFLLSQKRAS